MRKNILFLFVAISLVFNLLGQSDAGMSFRNLNYRATLLLPGGALPFQMQISIDPKNQKLFYGEITNGSEVINISFEKYLQNENPDVYFKSGDSIKIEFPVFNTEIIAKINPDLSLSGIWYDRSRPGNYFIPFQATINTQNISYRFVQNPKPAIKSIEGKYTVVFSDESSTDTAVGIFKQDKSHLTGTFLTTTGDYRFLEGEVSADSFFLSAFDGSHAFLFKGKITIDGNLSGAWWSGKHYAANFTAVRDENAVLPDPKSLTFLKPGYKTIQFSFPDENGKMIALSDEEFKDKVVIIQIVGSWCPNCMDETSYLSEIEENYKNKNLAIVALSFERQTDAVNFKKNIDKLKSHFGISYPFLNAGLPKDASDALPMLNKVMSFPTSIVLNKNHEVVEIYTGFSGPATGDLFVKYQHDFEVFLDNLLQ